MLRILSRSILLTLLLGIAMHQAASGIGSDERLAAVSALIALPSKAAIPNVCTQRMRNRLDLAQELWDAARTGEPTMRVVRHDERSALIVVAVPSADYTPFYCRVIDDAGTWNIDDVAVSPVARSLQEAYRALQQTVEPTREQSTQLQRLALLAGPDSVLTAFAIQHVTTLSESVALYQSGKRAQSLRLAGSILIESIDEAEEKGMNRLEFVIGSQEGAAAGCLYAPSSTDLPEIMDTDYIYIEQVAPMWYVFRSR
jgi:hypothetical protein